MCLAPFLCPMTLSRQANLPSGPLITATTKPAPKSLRRQYQILIPTTNPTPTTSNTTTLPHYKLCTSFSISPPQSAHRQPSPPTISTTPYSPPLPKSMCMECSVLLTRGLLAREVGGALKTECACNTSTGLIMLITTIRHPKQSEIIRRVGRKGHWAKGGG